MTQLCINKFKASTPLSTLSRSLSHLTTTPETQTHLAYTANTNKTAILDTGAENSAFHANANTPPTGRSMTTVIQPNGETSTPLSTRQYTVAGIPFTAHIFQPAQIRNPLLSAHDICSQGASITLESTGASIKNSKGQLILYSPRDTHSRLWSLPIADV